MDAFGRLIIPVVLAGIAFFLAPILGLERWIHPQSWDILAFFACLGFLNYRLIERGMADNRDKFVTFYLASMVLRMLVSFAFLIAYVLLGTLALKHFILEFFVLYLFFASFEIAGVYTNLRHFSEKKP
ncbi:MAG: hypothetical protein QM669_15570 [Siphonobacter sp.]